MITLQTRRLVLAPCQPGDAADFIGLERDAEVMRFLHRGAVDHNAVGSQDVSFLMPRGNESYVWTARRKDDEAFVGWFCLYPEAPVLAELGYRLKRDGWWQGLATEGAGALVDWGFGQAGYETIFAGTMAVNLGSRRVMEKLGMTHVATDFPVFDDPIPGTEEGEVRYELERRDWQAGKPL
ncbi:GNAT family N-acetyltransferase [Rhizobiales bacterium RZME27]|uniref:GNAT family N-acetyltransferase n=1 Tax=Endobacterium cereale TaxID=2663029 RepID=A0A6A8A6R0_9HYPH|nr:GNAT family N-acetyltransferase [Endobacterium cereale]MEB2843611.1 GNAT family N-acetyltransferase [Endobacterium cereale]MQY45537.1 GNAT family N-acetyltransferase [Endobacterium cereale]